jgi:quercetin dioxygenase-like cupin family protein
MRIIIREKGEGQQMNGYIFKKGQTWDEVFQPADHSDVVVWRLAGPTKGFQLAEVWLGEYGPQGAAEGHTHEDMDQMVLLIEGNLRYKLGDQEGIMEPGDFVFMPRGVYHEAQAIADKNVTFVVYTPPPKNGSTK